MNKDLLDFKLEYIEEMSKIQAQLIGQEVTISQILNLMKEMVKEFKADCKITENFIPVSLKKEDNG